jgi:hypothetical protein
MVRNRASSVPRVTDGKAEVGWRGWETFGRACPGFRDGSERDRMACRWHQVRPMTATIRVASLVELPPGKGKVVEIAGRYITVFNRDGRFHAASTPVSRRAPLLDTSATCPARGMGFDVYMEDSPAHLRDAASCHIRVDGDSVWLVIN